MSSQTGTPVSPTNGGTFTLVIVCSINVSNGQDSKRKIIISHQKGICLTNKNTLQNLELYTTGTALFIIPFTQHIVAVEIM